MLSRPIRRACVSKQLGETGSRVCPRAGCRGSSLLVIAISAPFPPVRVHYAPGEHAPPTFTPTPISISLIFTFPFAILPNLHNLTMELESPEPENDAPP